MIIVYVFLVSTDIYEFKIAKQLFVGYIETKVTPETVCTATKTVSIINKIMKNTRDWPYLFLLCKHQSVFAF